MTMVCVEQPLASHGSAKYYGCFQLISKIQFVFPTTVSMTRWYNGMDVNKFKFYFVFAEVINKTHCLEDYSRNSTIECSDK